MTKKFILGSEESYESVKILHIIPNEDFTYVFSSKYGDNGYWLFSPCKALIESPTVNDEDKILRYVAYLDIDSQIIEPVQYITKENKFLATEMTPEEFLNLTNNKE